jgi:REP element-mobilizing transposase RayT
MTLFKNKYRVETTRLTGWDYRSAGYYFVTICTHDRACYLGEIRDGEMLLSPQGEILAEEWQRTGTLRGNIVLDEWVTMPNHFHAIISIITDVTPCLDAKKHNRKNETCQRHVSTAGVDVLNVETSPVARLDVAGLKSGSLGAIINQFKSVCTKRIRAAGHVFGWQARYYEQIIRNEKSLHDIRKYVVNNPMKWQLDNDNSDT